MLVRSLNKTLEGDRAPEAWKLSRAKMIRKTDKPTVRDFRPIAIIEASCKIYFTFLKRGIEEHLRENGMVVESQMGFTAEGRVETARLNDPETKTIHKILWIVKSLRGRRPRRDLT